MIHVSIPEMIVHPIQLVVVVILKTLPLNAVSFITCQYRASSLELLHIAHTSLTNRNTKTTCAGIKNNIMAKFFKLIICFRS